MKKTVHQRQTGAEEGAPRPQLCQRLLDLTEDAVYRYTVTDGRILSANRGFVRMLGLDCAPEELVGKRLKDVAMHTEPPGAVRDREEAHNVEWYFKTLKGEDRRVILDTLVVNDPETGESVVEAIARDTTERYRAEEAARESEEKYRGLVEHSLEGIGISQGNRVVFANQALLDIFGYDSIGEFMRVPLLDHVAPESREMVLDKLRRKERGEAVPQRFEYRILRKNGETRDIEVSTSDLSMGGERYTQSTFRDVSDRNRTEASLRGSWALLHSVSSGIPGAILYQLVRPPDGSRRFTYVSEGVHLLYGCSAEEAMADPGRIYSRVCEEDRDRVLADEEKAFRELIPFRAEVRMRNPDGSLRWSYFASNPRRLPDGSTSWDGIEIDITDRKKAETALGESEEKYRALVETTGTGFVILDLAGRVLDANAEYVRLTGRRSLADIRGIPVTEWTAPYDRERNAAAVRACIENGCIRNLTIAYSSPSGSLTPVEINATVLKAGAGERILSLVRDITERRRAEEAVREGERRYRNLFDSMVNGFALHEIILDEAGVPCDYRYIEANPAFERLTGLRVKDIVGRRILEIAPQTERHWIDTFGRVAMTGETVHFENYWAVRQKYYEVIAYRPAPGQFACVFTDITERKKAEETVRRAAIQWQTTFGALESAVWLLDKDMRIVIANSATQKVFKKDPKEVVGRCCWEIVHGSPKPIPECPVVRSQTTRKRESMELQIGAQWVEVTADPVLDDTGGPIGTVHVVSDITERKRVEAELARHRDHLEEMVRERTQQLEDANRELDAFTYSVSHDLKVPLRALNGFSRILTEDCSAQLGAEGRRAVDVISASATRMGRQIDELLTFSRLGRLAVTEVRTDMKALAVSVCGELRKSLPPDRKVRLDIQDLPAAVADPSMMRRVFENLVSNALKFTRPREEAHIEIGSGAAEKEHVYFVKDNGVGFDMRYAAKLFGVFQRLHTEAEFEGTGVGLAIVQKIVQKHGGRVWAEGNAGEGATFYFSLPKGE